MRASVLAFVALALASPAAAQPSLPADGGALYLTSTAIDESLGLGDNTYEIRSDAGAPGGVPLGAELVYYSYDVRFIHAVEGNFTYFETPVVKVPIRCNAAWAGSSTSAYLYVNQAEVAVGSLDFPLTCVNGQVMELVMDADLQYLSGRIGDEVSLRINSPLAHPGNGADLEVVTGDAAHPAGLFGNWTSEPLFVAWSDDQDWDACCGPNGPARLYTTGADGVSVVVDARLDGSSASDYLDFTVTDILTGDQVLAQRYEQGDGGPRDVHYETILNTGGDARWLLDVSTFSLDSGGFNITMTPVIFELAEKVEQPVVNEGGNVTTPPSGPQQNVTGPDAGLPSDGGGEDSPGPGWAVGVAVAAAALLFRRRRTD